MRAKSYKRLYRVCGGAYSNTVYLILSAYNNYTRADFALDRTGFRIKLRRAV